MYYLRYTICEYTQQTILTKAPSTGIANVDLQVKTFDGPLILGRLWSDTYTKP